MSVSLTQFNDTLEQFVEYLISVSDRIDLDVDVRTYKLFLTNLRSMNATKPLQMYRDSVYPHKVKIMEGDEDFFLNRAVVSEDMDDSEKKVMMDALAIKQMWENSKITKGMKKKIKNFLKALIILSEQC